MEQGWERLWAWEGGTVAALAAAPDGETVFAATPVGVFRRRAGEDRWALVGAGQVAPFVEALALSPHFAEDRTLIAGTQAGVYRSRDGGERWTWAPSARRVTAVAYGASPADILVGTDGEGIWRSTDGGETWAESSSGLDESVVLALAVARDGDTATAFAGTEAGLYRSDDGGGTWHRCVLPVEETVVQCVVVRPAGGRPAAIWAGTEADGLLVSRDGGDTWSAVTEFADTGVTAIAAADDRRLAVATGDGISVSGDGGETWSAAELPTTPALALLWAGDRTLLAGMPNGGLFRSTDRGVTWQSDQAGLTAQIVNSLVAVRLGHGGTRLLAALTGRGVELSDDGGATWTPAGSGLADPNVSALAASPHFAADATVYAATPAGLHVSQDGGVSWQLLPIGDEATPVAAVAVGAGPEPGSTRVIAVSPAGEIAVSDDAGASWAGFGHLLIGQGDEVTSIALSPGFARDRTLYVGTRPALADPGAGELRLWRSTDGGLRWGVYFGRRGAGAVPAAIALDAYGEPAIFTAVGGLVARPMPGTRETRRGGDRPIWSTAPLVADPGVVTAIVASPRFARDGTLFAASSAGAHISRDGGRRFSLWVDGLAPGPVVALALAPDFPADPTVWAVSLGGVVYRRRA